MANQSQEFLKHALNAIPEAERLVFLEQVIETLTPAQKEQLLVRLGNTANTDAEPRQPPQRQQPITTINISTEPKPKQENKPIPLNLEHLNLDNHQPLTKNQIRKEFLGCAALLIGGLILLFALAIGATEFFSWFGDIF